MRIFELAQRRAQRLLRMTYAACTLLSQGAALAQPHPVLSRDSEEPSIRIMVAGSPELVFEGGQSCDKLFIPDAPARAFRDARKMVHLIASSYRNWFLTGPSLSHLSPQCAPTLSGAENGSRAAWDDRAWIEATYTPDGRTIYALVSNERDLFRHPDQIDSLTGACGIRQYQPPCTDYSINLAVSRDMGRHFHYDQLGIGHVVARSPYPIQSVNSDGFYWGFGVTSNIFEAD